MTEADFEKAFRKLYGKPSTFLEMEQFKKSYYATRAIINEDDLAKLSELAITKSWREERKAEKKQKLRP